MEILALSLFCAALLGCVLLDVSILCALAAGFLIFCLYGRHRGIAWRELFRMALAGVNTVKGILTVFLLIGIMTALWRSSGTIAVIISWAARLITPGVFPLMAFLLNCAVSVLTGTSFGTSATMGVICMTMGQAMGANPVISGGAILSGVLFGDRCSPVSTSAHLICELTGTEIFTNIRLMLRSALVPFLAACGVYALLGLAGGHSPGGMDVEALFAGSFSLRWPAILPAAAILLLSALRVNVKTTMLVSIGISAALCLAMQGRTAEELIRTALFGYEDADAAVGRMLDGGGLLSMVRTGAIVCVSSSYAGLFEGTELLAGAKRAVERSSGALTNRGSVVLSSVLTSMIACNQTLAIMLTQQLCRDLGEDSQALAIELEDSVVVIAPLIPWCIAGAVPVATIGAPTSCLLAACYLYFLPLWSLVSQRQT